MMAVPYKQPTADEVDQMLKAYGFDAAAHSITFSDWSGCSIESKRHGEGAYRRLLTLDSYETTRWFYTTSLTDEWLEGGSPDDSEFWQGPAMTTCRTCGTTTSASECPICGRQL